MKVVVCWIVPKGKYLESWLVMNSFTNRFLTIFNLKLFGRKFQRCHVGLIHVPCPGQISFNGSSSKNTDIKTPLVVSFSLGGFIHFFAAGGVLMSGFFEGLPL